VNGHDISRHVGASSQSKAKVADRNEEDVDASVEDLNASVADIDASVGDVDATDAPIEPRPAGKEHEEPVFDVGQHIARLEASTGAALALLRRCIVEDKSPTREALAAEAEFAFGMPSDAALAEIDQIAEMVGISSLR
jgi:hypothetical protein